MRRVREATSAPELLEKTAYLAGDKASLVKEAYEFAEWAHEGQWRASGEPYIEHPLHTALYLADLDLDAPTVAAALLHDVVEDCDVSREDLAERFGEEVATLVDGVTKLTQVTLKGGAEGGNGSRPGTADSLRQAESLRKMLLAMAEDIRVVLIKLADRLHNMRTINALSEERRRAIARETLEIYAPLAHRLGMWEIKWQLEDLAFRQLDPETYHSISRLLATNRAGREEFIERVVGILQQELEHQGIKAEVTGRPKHIYSVYRKMRKYAAQGKQVGDIYDLYAVRVLVRKVHECYAALGAVHQLWRPLAGQFDDYIANPKENLYQSLHTTVVCPDNTPLEIQIRTYDMHQLAEYGVAAHWRYKEGLQGDTSYEAKMAWLRQLLEWQREVSGAEEFLETVKMDLFRDQVFVYTPRGEIKELPAGSTPLDFAYRIHTELGHRCIGAKVNGKLVPLTCQLQNGETVEVLASKTERGPTLDWLNPDLGYVTTASARQKVRTWFRKQERQANAQRGRDLLLRELRRLGLKLDDEQVAHTLKMDSAEELFVALGNGSLTIGQVANRLMETEEEPEGPKISRPVTMPSSGVEVLGVGDLLMKVGACCSPVPGDPIVGFVTRSSGVTVHRKDCKNIAQEDEPERLIPVNWTGSGQLYPVRVRIDAWDRVALLRDVTTQVSAEGVNIASVFTSERKNNTVVLDLTLFITGLGQLSRIFNKLEGVKGVISVMRTGRPQHAVSRAKR